MKLSKNLINRIWKIAQVKIFGKFNQVVLIELFKSNLFTNKIFLFLWQLIIVRSASTREWILTSCPTLSGYWTLLLESGSAIGSFPWPWAWSVYWCSDNTDTHHIMDVCMCDCLWSNISPMFNQVNVPECELK